MAPRCVGLIVRQPGEAQFRVGQRGDVTQPPYPNDGVRRVRDVHDVNLRGIKSHRDGRLNNDRSGYWKEPMSYRSLLVFLDQDPLCAPRTQVAIRLARDHDCHLVGVAPTGLVDVLATPDAAATLVEFAERARSALREEAEDAIRRFSEACRAAGLESVEAIVDEADKARSLVHHAHCSDLTLLNQADPTASSHRRAQDLVEQVVLNSARPTLIIPYAGRFETLGSNVMVAWDESREVVRALSDALPLLRRAKRVQVVSWNEKGVRDDRALRARLDALHQWLMWQGVSAEVRVETTEVDISNAMLSHAADLNADLIVMGAYGHTRWVERILGGATRGLLASMTIPVLMAH